MNQERAISDVLQDILRNLQEMVRAEVRLAKAEIRDDARQTAASAVWIVAGTIGALSAWAFLLWTIVFALSTLMSIWAATLAVAVVLAVCLWRADCRRHPKSQATSSHPGANDCVDQGERRMDQTTAK